MKLNRALVIAKLNKMKAGLEKELELVLLTTDVDADIAVRVNDRRLLRLLGLD